MTNLIILALLLAIATPLASTSIPHRAPTNPPPKLAAVITALLDASREYHLDPMLAFAVAWKESTLNPGAVSLRWQRVEDGLWHLVVIARGLMQISKQYQDELVVRYLGWSPRNFNWRNPVHSAKLGCAYLRSLIDRFGLYGAICSYNAGDGRYQRCLKGEAELPEETVQYAKDVLELLYEI